jgi:serine phosphatase RsbU (regulator of sigma subunit)
MQPVPLARFQRDHRYLELLVRAGEILASALDWHQTVTAVVEAVVETVADICLLDLKSEDGHLEPVAAAHADKALTATLRGAGAFVRVKSIDAVHPAAVAAATGEAILVENIDEGYLRSHSVSAAHEQFMRRMGYCSMMVLPLVSTTQGIIGAITFVRTDRSDERYDEESLRFAHDLARRCATAIGKAQLYEQTLRIATVYQRAALPERLPVLEGLTFDSFYEPSSEELLVGGDWYDAFELTDGRVAVTIGDVLGHGLEAATWMSRLRNGLRAALCSRPDPAHALGVADQMLRMELREEFATALVALVDPRYNTLSCASAGHPGPLIWNGSGEAMDPFVVRGLPLGLRDFGSVAETAQTLTLTPGSFAAFFTDGLLEWNRNIEEAWLRMKAAVERPDVREALHPAHALRSYVMREAARHEDDLAILTIRVDSTLGKPGELPMANARQCAS